MTGRGRSKWRALARKPNRRALAARFMLGLGVAATLLPIGVAARPPAGGGAPAAAPIVDRIAPVAPAPVEPVIPAAAPPPAPPPAPSQAKGPPGDPRLAQVYALLESYCAQCHQSGRLTRAAPAAGLANILDLEEIAREPQLVSRGLPDASRLYQVLLDRHRPVDLGSESKWPAAEDIQRLRTWIEELPVGAGPCSTPPVTQAQVAAAIDTAARAAGEAEAQELRFVTLAHLANACATPAEMEAYRQGVSKLLNSLSWGARPVTLVPVDVAKTVLSFKLSDLGWVDEHWTAIARAEPKGVAMDLSGQVSAPGASARPIRGDWLAWSASQPSFYAELLGLPPTLDETARLLGIKRDGDPGAGRPMRAAIKTSAITRGPRVVEQYRAEQRRLWLAYDFLDGTGDRDVFERPLGGVRGAPDRAQFRADGQRMIFSLPNGFLGFAILDADGRRIDQLPQRLEVESARALGPTVAGLSCLSCHTAGLKPVTDGMRAHLGSDKYTGSREAKDQALAIYDTASEWARVFDEDGYRYRRALIQAGVDPDLTVHGLEPVAALARRYTVGVDMEAAAAEALLAPGEIAAKLDAAPISDRSLVQRLRQGILPRADANRVLAAFKAAPADGDTGLATAAVPQSPGLKLAVWTDRATYKAGDLMTVHAHPSAPCHLTLISVNGAGKATVLFPNEFDPDNLVAADAPFMVPAEKAQYQFRFKDRGAETIVAACQTVAKFPAGIEPDYERQRFTVLGNYENFVRTSFGLDSDPQRAAARVERPRPARPAAKDAKPEPPKTETRIEQTARAAVRIVIE